MHVASRRLIGAIALLGPADRALLNLWVQRGMDDSAIARLSSAPTDAVTERRQAVVHELAERLGLPPADVLAALERMAHDDAPRPPGAPATGAPVAEDPFPDAAPDAGAQPGPGRRGSAGRTDPELPQPQPPARPEKETRPNGERRRRPGGGAGSDTHRPAPKRARPGTRAHRAAPDPERAGSGVPPRARRAEAGPTAPSVSAAVEGPTAPSASAAVEGPTAPSASAAVEGTTASSPRAAVEPAPEDAFDIGPALAHRPGDSLPDSIGTRRSGPRRAVLVGALLIVVLAAAVVVAQSSSGGRSPSRAAAPSPSAAPSRSVAPGRSPAAPGSGVSVRSLTPLPGIAWHGRASVTLAGSPGHPSFAITVTALSPLRRDHYEAWLYNSISDAVPLGTLTAPVAHLHSALPADYRRYAFVDVSLQGPSSGPHHSGQSVLRAPTP